MIKRFVVSLFILAALVIVYDSNYNIAHTNQNGAPAGHTGSPDDGKTCKTSGCHLSGPNPTDHVATITSDVPVSGYLAGHTYTITATAVKAGVSKFGFQLSPQDADGNKLGSFVLPLPAGMQGLSSNKYVTHTLTGTPGSGTRTWSMEWTAPATAGTGTITFYGAFNFTNSSSSSVGDVIKTATLEITEDPFSSINETAGGEAGFTVFPNPAGERITISFFMYEPGIIHAEVFDINGRLVKQTTTESLNPGRHELFVNAHDEMETGLYFIRLNDGKESYTQKIIIQ